MKSVIRGILVLFALGAHDAAAATVAAGVDHTAIVDASGNVWTWGRNDSGQLGNGGTTLNPLPVQVTGVTGVVAVAAGQAHTLALTDDGRVFAWGGNAWGQLGDGTTSGRTAPYQVATGISRIAAGQYHSIALKTDGTVLIWGANGSGQLGDGTQVSKSTPQAVPSLTGVAAVAGGYTHTLIAKTDGAVWAWGSNGNGQLGDGSTTPRLSPVAIITLAGVAITDLAAGNVHSLARAANGLVYAWGNSNSGQLGDGTVEQRLTPIRVVDLQNISAISASALHSAAVETDGTPWGWGSASYGALGDGVPLPSTIPVNPSPGPVGAVSIGAGDARTVVATADGTIWAWGANAYGEIGDGTTADRPTPVKVLEAGYTPKVGTPIFGVNPGTYTTTKTVALTTVTAGASIYYTTDGSEPTALSTAYTGTPIAVNVTTTIRARAYKSSVDDSNIATGTFALRVVSPTLTPAGGTYTSAQSVSMSTTTSGATIRYSTGTPPTASSSVYSGAVNVATSAVLYAVASKSGWDDSYMSAATYVLSYGTLSAPTISPAAGTYVGSVSVTLTAATGATIRYTTDGSEPSATSPVYSSAIVSATTKTVGLDPIR